MVALDLLGLLNAEPVVVKVILEVMLKAGRFKL